MQKIKSREPQYITRENQQTMKEKEKEGSEKNHKNNHKASKMTKIHTYQ